MPKKLKEHAVELFNFDNFRAQEVRYIRDKRCAILIRYCINEALQSSPFIISQF